MSLLLRKVHLADDVYNVLVSVPIQYVVTRVDIKEYIFKTRINNWNMQNLVKGVLPTKIVLAMVARVAANGNYAHNPFNFVHVDLAKLEQMVDDAIFDGTPLEFDYATHQYADGFRTL